VNNGFVETMVDSWNTFRLVNSRCLFRVRQIKKCPRSSNSLLSIPTDNQSPEIDYDCDLYGDHSFDQTNLEVNNDDSFTDGDSIISTHDDSLEQYYPIHNHTQDKEDFVCNNSRQRSNAGNIFQVMLHDLIMKHNTSLQMFDNICNLVNEYTSSPDFLVNTKLQSRKSFLHSVKGIYPQLRRAPWELPVSSHTASKELSKSSQRALHFFTMLGNKS
jgi:hypothetical protein